MKLFYAPTSPYARKVLACAISREIDGQIALVSINPHVSPPELLVANPLSKVPCLVTSDGLALFDSPVICEYLDSVVEGVIQLFPRVGGPRWRALKLQAMADGILDAAVGRRMEQAKPVEEARTTWMNRQKAAIDRTLEQMEKDLPHKALDIGTISVACALGYLDFRFAAEDWRPARPQLAAWFAAFAETPGLARTVPRDPT